jgi:hypothetical protein
MMAAVLMLPFAGYLHLNLEIAPPRAARVIAGALIAGIVTLTCACLVVPQHVHDVFGFRRLHEFIARSAAGFIAVSMLSACWCAWKGFTKSLLPARLFWTWSLVTLLPLGGIFLSESFLLLTRLKPNWAVPIRSVLRHFCLLAPRFLGMAGVRRNIRISLRGGFVNTVASDSKARYFGES